MSLILSDYGGSRLKSAGLVSFLLHHICDVKVLVF